MQCSHIHGGSLLLDDEDDQQNHAVPIIAAAVQDRHTDGRTDPGPMMATMMIVTLCFMLFPVSLVGSSEYSSYTIRELLW